MDDELPASTGRAIEFHVTLELTYPVEHPDTNSPFYLDGRMVRDGDQLEVDMGLNCWASARFRWNGRFRSRPKFVIGVPLGARRFLLKLLLPPWEPLYRWPLDRATAEYSVESFDMKDAISALVKFGEAYSTARGGAIPERDWRVMGACELLLERLTGRRAQPKDVEAVYSHHLSASNT